MSYRTFVLTPEISENPSWDSRLLSQDGRGGGADIKFGHKFNAIRALKRKTGGNLIGKSMVYFTPSPVCTCWTDAISALLCV